MATAFTSIGVYACDACGVQVPYGEVLMETHTLPYRTYGPCCAPQQVPPTAYAEALRRYQVEQEGKAQAQVGCHKR